MRILRNLLTFCGFLLVTTTVFSQNYTLPWIIKPIIGEVDKVTYRDGNSKKHYAIVEKNGLKGLVDTKGKQVLPIEYNVLSVHWVGTVYAEKGDQKFNFAPNMKPFADSIQSVIPMEDGRFLLENQNGQWGVSNKKMKTVIPFNYQVDQGLETVSLINSEKTIELGRLIMPDGQASGLLTLNLDLKWPGVTLYKETKGPKMGIMGKKNVPLTPPIYSFYHTKGDYAVAFISKKIWGVINSKGDTLVPFDYEELGKINNALTTIFKKDGKIGVLNVTNGRIVIPVGTYDDIKYVNGEMEYYVVVKNQKQGICDSNGKEILAPRYDTALKSGDYLYVVEQKSSQYPKRGLFSTQGQELLKPDSVKLLVLANNTIYVEELDGTSKHLDQKMEIVRTFLPGTAKPFAENWISVQDDQGRKFYHANSTKINPIWYDEVGEPKEDKLHVVKKDGFWGVVHNSGEVLIPTVMDEIVYNWNSLSVKYKGKWGIVKNTFY
jgi:hypothetical protein